MNTDQLTELQNEEKTVRDLWKEMLDLVSSVAPDELKATEKHNKAAASRMRVKIRELRNVAAVLLKRSLKQTKETPAKKSKKA